MNIDQIATVWLYAYSSHYTATSPTFHTVFVATTPEQQRNGRPVLAQVSLSYVTSVTTWGGGALVTGFTPPFGPPFVTKDFKDNSLYAPQATAVTFQLVAKAAELYAVGTIYLL